MKKFAGLLAFLLLSVPALPVVITSTTCSVTLAGTTVTQTDPSACAVVAGGTAARASMAGTESLPLLGAPTSPVGSSFQLQVSAAGLSNMVPGTATASGTSQLLLSTSGPVRTGYLAFREEYEITGFWAPSTSHLSIGSLAQYCSQSGPRDPPTCTGDLGLAIGNGTGIVPFPLGGDFAFTFTVMADAGGGGGNPHFAFGATSFHFTLLEADRATPVQIDLIPEPSTLVLLALGCSLLLCRGVRDCTVKNLGRNG
jgi:hypothetical protein